MQNKLKLITLFMFYERLDETAVTRIPFLENEIIRHQD